MTAAAVTVAVIAALFVGLPLLLRPDLRARVANSVLAPLIILGVPAVACVMAILLCL
jgi:hypothetical protein